MKETKIIIVIENVLGIHRNYIFLGKGWRALVQIRVLIESCIIAATFFFIISSKFDGFSLLGTELDTVAYFITLSYVCLTTINTLTIFISSCVNSKYFKEFLFNINAVHEMFKDDELYKRHVTVRLRRFYLDIVLFAVTISLMMSTYIYDSMFYPPEIYILVIFIYEICQQCRFFYENFVFFEYIDVICVTLKFLIGSTSEHVDKLNDEQDEVIDDGSLKELRDELEKWAKASQLLVAASDNLRRCFGTQVKITNSNYFSKERKNHINLRLMCEKRIKIGFVCGCYLLDRS